jgi:hypothetical protein
VSIAATPLVTRRVAECAAHPLAVWVYLVAGWHGVPRNLRPDEHIVLAWFTVDQAMTLPLATPLNLDVFRPAARLSP